jgi:hypothetical protein
MSLFPSGRRNPFWSAIITQVWGSVSVPTATYVYVDIQPPVGETWLIWIDYTLPAGKGATNYMYYADYDGAIENLHKALIREPTTNYNYGHYFWYQSVNVCKVLTNSLYARFCFYQNTGATWTGRYGYSGFKLSQPLWNPLRKHNPEPPKSWKRKLTVPLPTEVEALRLYAFEMFSFRLNDYVPAIMLEEDTPLAVDPATKFPVERLTAVVTVENLVNILKQREDLTLRPDVMLEAPPKYRGRRLRELTTSEFEEATGYKKYFQRWGEEGIEI